jgi:hypothetical protein
MSEETQSVIGKGFEEALQKVKEQAPDAPVQQVQVEAPSPSLSKETAASQASVSDNPFEDFLGAEPKPEAQSSTDDVEPDFDKQLDEEIGKEPSGDKEKAAWGKLRTKAKSAMQKAYQLERSNALLEKERNELKTQAPSVTDEYKSKYEAILQKNAILALQENQDFQQNVALPYQESVNVISSIIQEFELPADKIKSAMNAEKRTDRNRQLSALLNEADMDDLSKADFLRAIGDYETFSATYNAAQEDAVALYEASKQKQAEDFTKGRQAHVEALKEKTGEVLGKFQSRPYFKEIFNSDSSAKEFQERVKFALEKEPTPEMAVFEKASSFALMPTINWGLQMKKERDEALESLRKQSAGGAAVGIGSAPSARDDGQKLEIGQGFAKALKATGIKV